MWCLLEFVVVEEFAEPLDFGRLKQADQLKMVTHEFLLVAGEGGNHGSTWARQYLRIS